MNSSDFRDLRRSVMSSKVNTLVVSNNKDRGRGSLRDMLRQSQEKEGNYDIVFQPESENKKINNQLKTGYFTIELQSPLPNLYRNNITINQTNPRSVILVPALAAKDPSNRKSGAMSNDNPGGVNGSMLYIGDTNYLYRSRENYTKKMPNVVINNVSFVRNQAKGGDGKKGAGGGFGAGGGISLIAGDLTIRNSIFQDLDAVAGRGGEPARGGDGALMADVEVKREATSGEQGGKGGLSSIPPRTTGVKSDGSGMDGGELNYDESLAPNGGTGGRGGYGTTICRGFISNQHHQGSRGLDGENALNFGMGGGGGGGGGGGAWYYNDERPGCFFFPRVYGFKGGHGGKGGSAGYFGGNGGQGGIGSNHGFRNWLDHGWDSNSPGEGSHGRDGLWEGGSIAILSGTANQISNGLARSSLNLDQVSFYSNEVKVISPHIWTDSSGSSIGVKDVYVGNDRENRKKIDPNSNINVRGMLTNSSIESYKPINTAPVFSGISVPRVPSVADFSDTVLQGTDMADRFNVSFEGRSTVAGITSDLTDPNNPINAIWREIVPDTKDQIMEEYQAKADTSYVETMFTPDRAEDAAFSLLEDGIATSLGTVTGLVPGLPGAGAGGQIGSEFAKDHLNYIREQVMMADVRDKSLEENKQNQKKMQGVLAAGSQASFAKVDLKLERTKVVIKNFELGKDIVTFPAPEGENVRIYSNKSKNDNTISFKYTNGSNANIEFLEVVLTDDSVNALGNNQNLSALDAAQEMLVHKEHKNGTKEYMLGTRRYEPFYVRSTSVSWGPGAVHMIVDRVGTNEFDGVPEGEDVLIETSRGSDLIYGTNENEKILSKGGDDMIFPLFGKDSVDGGSGSDLVSYAHGGARLRDQLVPVELKAIDSNTVQAKKIEDKSLNESKDGVLKAIDSNTVQAKVEDKSLNECKDCSILKNIENFYMFGASHIDLGTLGKPETGQYNIATGVGGIIKGSSSDDTISISFNPAWNGDVSAGFENTIVDGGEGFDTLVINTKKSSPRFDVYVKSTGDALKVYRKDESCEKEEDCLLVEATGIDHFDSTTPHKVVSKDSNSIPEDVNILLGVDNDFGEKVHRGIQGSKRNDLLIGGATGNEIYAKKGDDTIEGGFGDDLIFPGKGRNIATGGAGDDRYHLSRKGSTDVIVVESGNEEIVNFDSKKDSIVFAKIEELEVSDTTSLKKSKRSGSNIVIQPDKNVIMYRNDGRAKFNTVRFEGFDLSKMPDTHLLDSTAFAVIDPTLA